MATRTRKKVKPARSEKTIRPEVMAHFRKSIEKNRKLLQLLAKS